MGLFDRKKPEPQNFPSPPPKIEPAFSEPPRPPQELDEIKERVETPLSPIPEPSFTEPPREEEPVIFNSPQVNVSIESRGMPGIPEPIMPTSVNPVLYVKLSEYKQVVEATNTIRKDVEKIKNIVVELRKIEKDEHSRLEKSEELIKEINSIINLFEKTMVAPTE